jgi:hypothetical protein
LGHNSAAGKHMCKINWHRDYKADFADGDFDVRLHGPPSRTLPHYSAWFSQLDDVDFMDSATASMPMFFDGTNIGNDNDVDVYVRF